MFHEIMVLALYLLTPSGWSERDECCQHSFRSFSLYHADPIRLQFVQRRSTSENMALNKVTGIRIPEDLMGRIQTVKGNRSLSQTLIDLVERGLTATAETEAPGVMERLEALEKK